MSTIGVRFGVFFTFLVLMASPGLALLTGWNADVHMDIDPTGGTIANDFHVEGIVKSGPPGGGWSKPPVLALHIDDRFTQFAYVIMPDPGDPDQNTFFFKADWSGAEYRYCEVLHLGLLFDVECHNLVIELVGWWTFNGEPLGGQNRGHVLIPGFDVQDEVRPQRLQVRNDSGGGGIGGISEGINGYLRQMDVVAMTREELQEWGSPEVLFEMLRLGGGQELLPWIPVVVEDGRPLEGPFMVDSFFDVFFEIELPDPSMPHPAEPITIAPGGFLLVREAVEFVNNAGEPDVRWTWHFHEAHEGQMHDLGDAPDSTNSWGVPMSAYPPGGPPQVPANFPTVYAAGSPPHGPIHWQPQWIHLGPLVTGETEADMGPDMDGVNNIVPLQDQPDLDMGDDGVMLPLNLQWCQPNNTFQYMVTVNNPVVPQMFVNVWFDWNMDGDWDDTLQCPQGVAVPEWAVQNQVVPILGPGMQVITTPPFAAYWLLGPIDHPTDHIWMRITIAEQPWQPTVGGLGFGGSGPQQGYAWGETEDYLIPTPSGPRLDFGDAPEDPTGIGYPTTLASNGARHLIGGPWLGDASDVPDAEADGQPDPSALGDDNDGNDDEDGVQIPVLIIGSTSHAMVEVGGAGGVLDAWIDWNGDRQWQEPAERIFGGFLPAGVHPIAVTPPAASVVGQTFARFRISTQGGLPPVGIAMDGEVEDHEVIIEPMPEPDHDFGDAPDEGKLYRYRTLLASNGARHKIDPKVFLGDRIDAEHDGQPTLAADGDDTDAEGDDEDGVIFVTWPLRPGRPATVEVKASVAGFLSAWIDFGADGDWTDPVDQIFLGLPISAGVNTLVFGVPLTAQPNARTYGRFRFATQPVSRFDGAADDGEVEDYLILVRGNPDIKWVQRPDVTRMGIDIRVDGNDGIPRVLADDFECTSFGWITDVHLWGSWKDDKKGEITGIRLSIHSDDPVGAGGTDPENEYSKPDKLLWERDFGPGEFAERFYAAVDEGEHWWDPYTGEFKWPGDHRIWQVDIRIPKDEAFLQEGSPERPMVYWLDVAVMAEGGEFGWKTRRWPEHYNDDSVMGVVDLTGKMTWRELRYPDGHPLHPESLDMAFVLTGDDTCTGCADLNCDGVINLADLAVLAEQYLKVWPFN